MCFFVLHVHSLHPDAPAAGDRVHSSLDLLTDSPSVLQDVTEGMLGQDISDCGLDHSLQQGGQIGQSRGAQSHVLYLVITHRAQLWSHQVLRHRLCTKSVSVYIHMYTDF